MSLDKKYYEAKAKGDSDALAKCAAECLAAGYEISGDGHLTATGKVKGAPPPISEKQRKATFDGDAKGIKKQ